MARAWHQPAFSMAWATAALFHFRLQHLHVAAHPPVQVLAIVVAMALLFLPRSTMLLAALVALQLADVAIHAPVVSNHYLLTTFANLVILAALVPALARARTRPDAWRIALRDVQPALRWLLVVLYLVTALHKINADFLDPALSCGTYLLGPLSERLGVAVSPAVGYLAIVGTLVVELVAGVLLALRRWAPAAALALPFHILIGFTGRAYYMDFSAVVLALFIACMREEDLEPIRAAVARMRWTRRLRYPFVALGFVLFAGLVPTMADGLSSHMVVWALYGGVGSLVVIACAAAAMRARTPSAAAPVPRLRPFWSVIVVAWALNGMSPYLGLWTENALAMYSNLRTGQGTNHLFIPSSIQFTRLQVPVFIDDTNIDTLRPFVGNTEQAPAWYSVWSSVDDTGRQARVRGRVEGQAFEFDASRGDIAPYVPPGWLRRIAVFKPVSLQARQPCTH